MTNIAKTIECLSICQKFEINAIVEHNLSNKEMIFIWHNLMMLLFRGVSSEGKIVAMPILLASNLVGADKIGVAMVGWKNRSFLYKLIGGRTSVKPLPNLCETDYLHWNVFSAKSFVPKCPLCRRIRRRTSWRPSSLRWEMTKNHHFWYYPRGFTKWTVF